MAPLPNRGLWGTTSLSIVGCVVSLVMSNPLTVEVSGHSKISPTVVARVSVVSCPTTFAIATPPSTVPPPASVAVAIPKSLAVRVVAYRDTSGLMTLLGPEGWSCTATYGADGSGGLVLRPKGESIPLSSWGAGWRLPSTSRDEAITAVQTGGSSAQAVAQACSLFPAAAAAFKADFGHPCPSPDKRVSVHKLGRAVVSFEDPASVHGPGIPSGGEYPASGVLTYSLPTVPGSYLATCTLPSPRHVLCTTVLDTFAAVYSRK